MKFLRYIFLLTSLFLWYGGLGQNVLFPGYPKMFYFSKDFYNASRQNWDITQDQRGYMYFANSDGVLIYDGLNWELIKLPERDIARDVKISESGKIYVCGYDNFGYLTADTSGNFKFVSLLPGSDTNFQNLGDIWSLIPYKHWIIFFNAHHIYAYNELTGKFSIIPVEDFSTGLSVVNDTLYIPSYTAFYKLNPENLKVEESAIPKILGIKSRVIFTIEAFHNKILVYTASDSLILTDRNFNVLAARRFSSRIYTFTAGEHYFFVNFYNQGLTVLDSTLSVVYSLDKSSGLPLNTYFSMYVDSYENLWIASDMGLNYIIFNSPVSYLDKAIGSTSSTFTKIFDKHLVVGLSYSLKSIDLNSLLSPYSTEKTGVTIPNTLGQSWDAFILDTLMYVAHNTDILQIDRNLNVKQLYVSGYNVWKIDTLPDGKTALIAASDGLYSARVDGAQLRDIKRVKNISGEIQDFIVTNDGDLWLVVYSDSDYVLHGRFDTSDNSLHIIKKYSEEQGLKQLFGSDLIYDSQANRIFINSDKTIKVYNAHDDSFKVFTGITKFFKGDNIELFLIGIDDLGNYWVNLVDYSQLPGLKYRIYLFKKQEDDPNSFIFNKYITNTLIFRDYAPGVTTYNNRYVFLATTKGPVIFDYNKYYNLKKLKFKAYIRKITSGDSVIWGGNTVKNGRLTSELPENLVIDFNHNNLTFYVTAPFFENPELTQFSYKLENLDKTWQPWTTDHKKEYNYLREGTYVFSVKAKNIYGIETPVLSFKFKILPPWYRSKFAYFVYFLLLAGVIYLFSVLYSYNLRKKNERLEKLVKERTKEIEMKNAELEQQKEEIQAQADELAQVNKELERLSIIAQRTDNAVILTDKDGNFVWVNPAFTKIFGYTLEELITQISPNIISHRTPPRIKQLVEKAMREKITVEYEAQYTTKDGKQIWVHTTLTPILDENNEIQGLIAVDSDITQLKIAEEKIRIQNENIKGSIKYAQVIQKSILPLKEEIDQYFDSFILYIPRDIVSGDFYWLSKKFVKQDYQATCKAQNPHFTPGEYLFFALVDCTGHGVPGAFMSLIGNRLLENIINQAAIHTPSYVLEEMDKRLADIFKHTEETHRDGMVVALCRFDKVCEQGEPALQVTFAGAKLNILHYISSQNKLEEHKGIRKTIGQVSVNKAEFKNDIFYAGKNDIIILYTDGYKDQNNIERRRIGITRFRKMILEYAGLPMEQIKQNLEQFLFKWMEGTEQRDDITVIGLKIKDL